MKIFVISDLHTEGYLGKTDILDEFLSKDIDLLIIAGDLTNSRHLEGNLKYICERTKNLVYVTGNHEYYRSSFEELDALLEKLSSSLNNFHWLHDTQVQISCESNGHEESFKFLGNTLWFPETPESKNPANKFQLADFSNIKNFDPKVYERHIANVKFLMENTKPGDIVVTHHAPSEKSVPPRFVGSPMKCYFASNQENIIRECRPRMWIHGHLHDPFDYKINSTRILCNPYGNLFESKNYSKEIIEIHPTEAE